VDTLLVSGVTVAGLLVGGVLDPLGQKLADHSRRDDERRRAEIPQSTGGEDETDGDRESAPGHVESAPGHVESALEGARNAAESDDSDNPGPVDRTVGALLPQGRAPARTACAALVTAVLFGAAAAHFGRNLILAPFSVFFAMLVVISVTDLSHRLVPRRLVYGALVLIVPLLAATSAVDHTWRDLTGSVIAAAVAFGLFFAIWWFIPKGMGFGDVRLAGSIGFTVGYLSLLHAYVAFLIGFVAGMLFGLLMMVISSSGRKTPIPFAPSLATGAVIAVLWGGPITQSLFHSGT
jgi:leader peptidase (prepilin peptidase) / N-methyltransferase